MYNFPYTNFHEINMDWILKKLQSIEYEAGGLRDVKYYGAIGDGITDDTEAIQNAVDNESYIIFPEGHYLISDNISVTSPDKHFIGLPGALIIANGAFFSISQTNNISFDNLEFDYINNKPQASIVCWRSLDITITNCKFSNGQMFNIQCSTCGRVHINNCTLDGTETSAGISLSSDSGYEYTDYGRNGYTWIENCLIKNSGLDGIIANNYNVTIRNCRIVDCGKYSPAAGIYCNSKNLLTIDHCYCLRNTGNGIDVVLTERVTITNSKCSNNDCAGIYIGGDGLVIIENCFCNANGSNPIDSYQDSGIVIQGYSGTDSSNIKITNCFAQSNLNYGFRFLNAINCYVNSILATGNTNGNIEIVGSIYQADYTVTT